MKSPLTTKRISKPRSLRAAESNCVSKVCACDPAVQEITLSLQLTLPPRTTGKYAPEPDESPETMGYSTVTKQVGRATLAGSTFASHCTLIPAKEFTCTLLSLNNCVTLF